LQIARRRLLETAVFAPIPSAIVRTATIDLVSLLFHGLPRDTGGGGRKCRRDRKALPDANRPETSVGRSPSNITSGPVVLAGHCYGGILAYEVAQRLVAAGRSRIPVVLIDTPAPGYPKIQLRRYLQSGPAAIRTLVRSGAHKFTSEIAAHIRLLRTRRLTTLPGSRLPASFTHASLNPDERSAISPSLTITPAGIVLRTYKPKPFSGPLACLKAGDTEVSERVLDDPRLGWRYLSRGLYISRTVAGRHDSMFEADNAPELAQQFRSLLRSLL
jgi:thioesterase domain-containing protein